VTSEELIGRLLLDVGIVILVGRAFAVALTRVHQPPVIAEILAGIALGPSLLGALPGDPSSLLFPDEVRAALEVIGGLGLVLFMFLIGLELDIGELRRRNRTVATVSLGALALPFTLGLGLAAVLHADHNVVRGETVPLAPFALFVATALSITAFPVLARLIVDGGLQGTPMAHLSMGAAAIQDGVGWVLLTVALAALPGDSGLSVVERALASAALAALLVFVVRPVLVRLYARPRGGARIEAGVVAAAVIGLAATAGTTQLLGLHSVLGAFAFGAIFPRGEGRELVGGLSSALAPTTTTVLLPIFFLGPGLNTDFGSLGGVGAREVVLILVIACVGKLLGAALPARLSGMTWREAVTLGVLLNTRGLVELVVLNVGLTAGVLDQSLFSALVLMALVTTMMTAPILRALQARGPEVISPPPRVKSRRTKMLYSPTRRW
jgi:Kef-type K+ transport system membrane component KefB